MTTLKLQNNDLCLDSYGQIALSSGVTSYADILASVIKTMKGEIILNTALGIDYFNTIFKSSNQIYIWKASVLKKAQSLSFVKNVTSFDVSYNSQTRYLSYTLVVETDQGTTTVTA